jgi:YD repeat-containing protein
MSNTDTIALERIDHGVVPSNDLGRAFRFWSSFMGARINFHANMNVRGLNREVPMMVFFTVANHAGFGLALQDFHLSTTPARRLEGVVWGFNRRETYWGPDPNLIPWHEPDSNTAYGYDPFGNRIQIGVMAKRPMHYGAVSRFQTS